MRGGPPDFAASRRTGGNRGFTLLEVLLALALASLVLVAMNTFIFSMGELWGRNSETHLFNQHVNAVTRFLQAELRSAVLPPSSRANATPIAVEQITPKNGPVDNLITFDLVPGSRVLSWPDNRSLPEVVCSLQVRQGEGLFLLWHSRLETRFSDDPPREMLLTPLVTGVSYDYYDDSLKRWTTATVFQNDTNGNPEAPQRLRLQFAYGKMTRQTVVAVPLAQQGMPNF
jgi:prepilin-type N-terminal cleavage/methylation domain-containing protein